MYLNQQGYLTTGKATRGSMFIQTFSCLLDIASVCDMALLAVSCVIQ